MCTTKNRWTGSPIHDSRSNVPGSPWPISPLVSPGSLWIGPFDAASEGEGLSPLRNPPRTIHGGTRRKFLFGGGFPSGGRMRRILLPIVFSQSLFEKPLREPLIRNPQIFVAHPRRHSRPFSASPPAFQAEACRHREQRCEHPRQGVWETRCEREFFRARHSGSPSSGKNGIPPTTQ